ncbi:hypothetical protein [Micromonospora sp. NPDC004704]
MDAAVPPRRILRRESQYQVADLLVDRWPARPGMRVRPPSGDQVTMPAQQRGRGDEEHRPAWAGQQPRQHRQYHPVGGLEIGAGHLAAQHRHLMAEHQDLHILGPLVAGELGQHLQDLAKQQVHQRRAHSHEHDGCAVLELAQNRTSDRRTEYSSPTRCEQDGAPTANGVDEPQQPFAE